LRPKLAGIALVPFLLLEQQKTANMSELNFAKSFLTTLDAKTTKYQPSHVFDPKTFGTRIPFTLPKLQHPPHPLPPKTTPSAPAAPGSAPISPTTTIILKSNRNPALSLTLPDLQLGSTSISQLKDAVQLALGGPTVVNVEKIKILYNKKPIPPSKKTVAEAIEGSGDGKDVEFGVMVIGGAPDQVVQSPAVEASSAPGSEAAAAEVASAVATEAVPMEGIEKVTSPTPAQGPSGAEVLAQAEFWDDLQGFLEQRLKDESEAVKWRKVFEGAWKAGG